jgi:hypothetical protein
MFELSRKNDTKIILIMNKISHIEPNFPNKNNFKANVAQQKIRNGYSVIMDNGKEIVITDEEFEKLTAALAD